MILFFVSVISVPSVAKAFMVFVRWIMECDFKKNLEKCACSYEGCSRRGKCCECVAYHRRNGEIPGCFFTPEAERTYDRSVRKFIATVKG